MNPAEMRDRIAQLLYQKVVESGRTMRDVSWGLGRRADWVSRVLKGHLELKVEHIYQILGELGLAPADFFAELHGPPAARPSEALGLERFPPRDPDAVLPGGFTFDELLGEVRRVVQEELESREEAQGGGEGG